jgi:hypothetical protein
MSEEDNVLRDQQTLGFPGGIAVLVRHAPSEPGVIRCDGKVLTSRRPPACSSVTPDRSGTIRPGDLFTDHMSGLELVCTFPGDGVLTFQGRSLQRLGAAQSRDRVQAGW